MRRWFLSYNSQDMDLARRVKAGIARKDIRAEVFFAPQSLRPGAYWMPALAKEIAEATAFILLVGRNGLGPWQMLEYQEAIDRSRKESDFAVVPVLLDGVPAPGLPFLRQLHWIIAADPASEKSVAELFDAAGGGGAPPGELWRHTAPYRGLSAMTETDADFFFGRDRETADVIGALEATADKIPLLLGNSGVGKSSLARAGVVAAYMRQGWPPSALAGSQWPRIFADSRRWCFLNFSPGAEPLRALVDPFLWTWQFEAVDPMRPELQSKWAQKLLDGSARLGDLLDATQARYRDELHQPEPPAFLLYIDQGEELYVRQVAERERRRFSEILANGVSDPRLRLMMSMRADFFGELQRDEALFAVHRQINVPPLREAQLHEIVSKPAEMLSARFETPQLADIITRRTAEDSLADVGALPLLSYTLDDMWAQMVNRGDATLRLPAQSFDLGAVLVDRANTFVATHPGAEPILRRILTLWLANVRDEGDVTRRRAFRSDFADEEWRLVSELADHPNRLLVTVATETGETYAEVAHEAIFRRWDKLREWIDDEREFLIWRTGLERDRRRWEGAGSRPDALLMGAAFTQAQSWLAKRAESLPAPDREFIAKSIALDKRTQALARGVRALVYCLVAAVVIALVWINKSYFQQQWRWYSVTRPYMQAQVLPHALTLAQEQALKPGQTFKECAADCPEMVAVPAGSFVMGSPEGQGEYDEHPSHQVMIAKPFAVSKFELTFADLDACIAYGECSPSITDSGWGRGQQPTINVSWNDAQQYVAWLSAVTGKPYRLLTEAEYEYAARGGKQPQTTYPWGNDIGKNNANCNGCGSKWDNQQTAPIGSYTATGFVPSFAPNGYGLYDMVGNVWEWVQDYYHDSYNGAPTDGSAWTDSGKCTSASRVARGGSWYDVLDYVRSANRSWWAPETRISYIGFRVARTLIAP
jgi:formylglycine-generating enzyme required for sulfatase activity